MIKLALALAIRPGDIVAFVGAGGKTTSMFRLARELVEQGLKVVTTTTTRIASDELRFAPHYMELGDPARLPGEFATLMELHRHVFIYTGLENETKVRGVSPGWLDEHLAQHPAADVVLCEADGSRRLPFKAPYPHERSGWMYWLSHLTTSTFMVLNWSTSVRDIRLARR
jgi:probable selenium-dependent hydroxylase accessory protein YqeC